MPKPLYVQAFEHYKENNDDTLKAYIAFGLYVDSECKWAESQTVWPTTAKYKGWFDCTVPHSTEVNNEQATEVLLDFANNVVEQERAEFLATSLDAYKEEAAKSEKGFLRGVLEATTGAFLYSVLLVVASIIIQRQGIDLVEVYDRIIKLPPH
jgi:hypothetical protein